MQDMMKEMEVQEDGVVVEEAGEKLVPVSESIRYRRRAQEAERKLEAMAGRFGEMERALESARVEMERLMRRSRVDELLVEADAIDLGAARILTEAALAEMDDGEVTEVVEDLRRHKPYLFRRRVREGSGGMTAKVRGDGRGAMEAAAEATVTGDRRALARYLRLRRDK